LTHHHSGICLYHREGLTLMFFVHGAACHRVKGAVAWPHHVTRGTGKGHLCGIPFKPIFASVEVGKQEFSTIPNPTHFISETPQGASPHLSLFLLRTRR
ncbi:uncharacterized protein TM35_001371000, partial [Trypanosoma theileri]